LVDLPNHIARHYIALNLQNNTDLSNFYSYRFTWFGNSTADILNAVIGKYFSPYTFVRITIGFYMVNFVFSVCVLYRTIKGHWGLWPLSSALLVFNGNFLWGFENYLVGVPFVLYGIAAVVYSQRQPFLYRFMIISSFAILLFIFHMMLGLLFGIAVLGYEFQRTFECPSGARLHYFLRSLTLAPTFLICIIIYILSPSNTVNIDGSYTSFGTFSQRLDGLTSISAFRYYLLFTVQNIWGLAIFIACIIAVILLLHRKGPRLEVAHPLKWLLMALVFTSLLMPVWISGVAFVHFRTPFLLAAVFIASVNFTGFSKRQLMLVGIILAVIFTGRVYQFNTTAKQYSTEIVALNKLFEKLPTGAKLMPIFGDKNYKRYRYHATAYAVTERQALIPTLFWGMQGLRINPKWDSLVSPLPAVYVRYLTFNKTDDKYVFHRPGSYIYVNRPTYYYDDWDKKFDYVLLINETDIPLEKRLPLEKIGSSGPFTLYKNLKLK
jgi:hypothetical protein